MERFSREKTKAQSHIDRWLHQLRRWWPFLLALVLLAVALYRIPTRFEQLALFALVAVTMAYAISAHEQAEASKRMTEEMKEQRLAALQPIIIQKAEYKAGDLHSGDEELPSNYFSHFVVWNAGNGPAIEVQISLFDGQESHLVSYRETFMRPGEQREFPFNLVSRPEGKHYLVCDYRRIFSATGHESWDQTWLPFELVKASKKGEVYVRPDELEFRFNIPKGKIIGAFRSKPKLR